MNQFERQKTILQANALANDLPEPIWEDEDFLFRGGNEDLFVTKKFMAFIHGKLRDPNLSLTAKRLYHFFNRNDISEYLRFPRAQFWEQVALDRWFKPHKFNLDRLLLIQFFMGNGLHGNWAKELTLSPYSFARSLCRKLKLPPIFYIMIS